MSDPGDTALLVEAVKNRQKFPRACVKALQDIEKSENDVTERVFYDHGRLPAWAAYVLTKKLAESNGHTFGKAKRQRLLERIEGLTKDQRGLLAKQVTIAIEPDRDRIEQIVLTARQRSDRPRHSNRQTAIPEDDTDIEEALGEQTDRATGGSDIPTAPSGSVDDTPAPDVEHHSGASVAACAQLFPPYLASAVRKYAGSDRPLGALLMAVSLTMKPPSESELRLEIMANRVEYIARELFNAHLETADGLRYLYLVGTFRALPTPRLTLTGCHPGSISGIFGQRIADAVSSTAAYQRDMEEGRDCTEGVQMIVSQVALEPAVICVTLPARDALAIKDQLYP